MLELCYVVRTLSIYSILPNYNLCRCGNSWTDDTPIMSKIIFTSVNKDGGDNNFHKVSWSCSPSIEDVLLYFDDRNASICKLVPNRWLPSWYKQLSPMRWINPSNSIWCASLRTIVTRRLFISIKFEPTLPDNPSKDCIVLDKFQNIYSIISDSVCRGQGRFANSFTMIKEQFSSLGMCC